jgi:hypothetical protein
MQHSHSLLLAFTLNFWVEAEKPGVHEKFFIDLFKLCIRMGCGGKFYALVEVGHFDGERYLVKSATALVHAVEYPLPSSFVCTNCGLAIRRAEEVAETISAEAEQQVKILKEQRKTAKAPWN